LILGCSTGALLVVGLCAGGIYWGYAQKRAVEDAVQAQAAALGRGNSAAACRRNSTRFLASMPCEMYVTWLNNTAPFFADSEITIQSFNTSSTVSSEPMVEVTVSAAGTRGNGRLTFSLLREGGDWRIDGVRP
jgi:hypothetical protein